MATGCPVTREEYCTFRISTLCQLKQVYLIDRCRRLHGGYGYMREYSVARAYLDARVQTIYGGTSEIMKEIIGRSLGV